MDEPRGDSMLSEISPVKRQALCGKTGLSEVGENGRNNQNALPDREKRFILVHSFGGILTPFLSATMAARAHCGGNHLPQTWEMKGRKGQHPDVPCRGVPGRPEATTLRWHRRPFTHGPLMGISYLSCSAGHGISEVVACLCNGA